jgi:hypothetical protein
MTDQERIARLESVLATLISWLGREIGHASAVQLLTRLEEGA